MFVYDGFGSLIAEYSIDTPEPNPEPQVSYLTTDTLGSPRIVTDQDGMVTIRRDFLPFGEEIAANENNRKSALGYAGDGDPRQRFTGYEKDSETNLEYAQNRYYANRLGRFTSTDPLMASGKVWKPQSWNRYVYVRNNPLNLIDPLGLDDCDPKKEPCPVKPPPIIQTGLIEVNVDDGYQVDVSISDTYTLPPKIKGKNVLQWIWSGIKTVLGFDSGGGNPTAPAPPTIPLPTHPGPTIPGPGPIEPSPPSGQSPDAPDASNPDAPDGVGGTAANLLTSIAIALAQKKIDELLNGKELEDGFVYRLGGPNPGNLAPRLRDINGLSAQTNEPPPSQEYIKLDVSKLRASGLVVVNDTRNHVAITPRNGRDLRQWQADKLTGAGLNNRFTRAVKDSIVRYNRGR